ncbi:MAG: chloride channel protein, partial [Novosphingobium sp.]
GLVAVAIAPLGDIAQGLYSGLAADDPDLAAGWTVLVFGLVAALTRHYAPEARGSGIPQVIEASRDPQGATAGRLLSLKIGFGKLFLTVGALAGGASVGREGPTVQVSAALMAWVHRIFKVPITAGVMIAGGAAGVAAAFNTPLAGIAFAIEELAVAYEQRLAVLVMGVVMISGLTSLGVAGDYVYFGHVSAGAMPVLSVIVAAPLAGIAGGVLGGLFSRLLLALRGPNGRFSSLLSKHPVWTAVVCGLIVAGVGLATNGATWGTGYQPTKAMLEGDAGSAWFGPGKFVVTLATAASGIPGGIFAPSLAVGAGFGEALSMLFPSELAGKIVLLGMAGYFVGVVRAPLTAVIILSETTGNSSMIVPLFAAALIGDWAAAIVCKQRLYHALAPDFRARRKDATDAKGEEGAA